MRSNLSLKLKRKKSQRAAPTVVFPVVISGLTDLGDSNFVGQVGNTLTAVSCSISGATIISSTWRWLRNSTPIAGATTATYTLVAGDDATNISVEQTPNLSYGSVGTVTSISFPVEYPAPTLTGTPLANVSINTSSGVQTPASAAAFNATPGVYSISPTVAGVSINPTTGVRTIDPGVTGAYPTGTFTVTKSNSGGAAAATFTLTVTAIAGPDHVMLQNGSSGLRYDITADTLVNLATADVDGYWLSCIAYYDGTNWSGVMAGLTNTGSSTGYLWLEGNRLAWRATGGSTLTTTALSDPAAPGWFLLTGRMRNGTTLKSGSRRILEFWRNEVTATAGSSSSASTSGLTTIDAVSVGYSAIDTPNGFTTLEQCDVMFGSGDPLAYHNWVYNAGVWRDPSGYNWAGDTGVTLIAANKSARIGTATFVATDDAIDTSSLGVPTLTGTPVWTAPAPPYSAGVGVTADVTAAAVPVGATSTVTVTATIPSGTWGTRTIDTTKIDVWSLNGPGKKPTVIGTSSSVAGLTCTVTLTVDRPIYVGEPIEVECRNNWLTCSNGNFTIAEEIVGTNSSADAWPATWGGVSLPERIAFEFDTPVAAQINGVMPGTARVPPGTTIVAEWPTRISDADPSDLRHGAMLNATRGTTQAFTTGGAEYSTATRPALPYTLIEGDKLIKARGNPNPRTEGGGSTLHGVWILGFAGLFAEAAAWTAYTPPPTPVLTPSYTPPRPAINTTATSLPSYSLAAIADKPTFAQVFEHLNRYNPILAILSPVEPRRKLCVSGYSMEDGYGWRVVEAMNAVSLHLIGDAPIADRRKLLTLYNAHGHTYLESLIGTGDRLPADGGQNQGEVSKFISYLCDTGQTARLATLGADVATNELDQYFKIDATLLGRLNAPHTNTAFDWPRLSHERIVESVSGLEITVVNAYNDSYGSLIASRMVRVSGGQAICTEDFVTGARMFKIDAQPTPPLAPGDVVWFRADHDQSVINYDFTIKGIDQLYMYSAHANSAYRNHNVSSGEHLYTRARGFMHSSFYAWDKYVVGSNTANFPTATNNWATTFSSYDGHSFDNGFWTTHWAAISAVAQTVG